MGTPSGQQNRGPLMFPLVAMKSNMVLTVRHDMTPLDILIYNEGAPGINMCIFRNSEP